MDVNKPYGFYAWHTRLRACLAPSLHRPFPVINIMVEPPEAVALGRPVQSERARAAAQAQHPGAGEALAEQQLQRALVEQARLLGRLRRLRTATA